MTHRRAVQLFAIHIGPGGKYQVKSDALSELSGHDLACWCNPDYPCHADTLLFIANGDPS